MDDDLTPDELPSLCPFCGAYSPRNCDLIDEAGFCVWEEMDDD